MPGKGAAVLTRITDWFPSDPGQTWMEGLLARSPIVAAFQPIYDCIPVSHSTPKRWPDSNPAALAPPCGSPRQHPSDSELILSPPRVSASIFCPIDGC